MRWLLRSVCSVCSFCSVGLATLGVAACSGSGTTTVIVPETALAVDPSQFLGGVTCGTEAGSMRSYVATLVDVTGFHTSYLAPGTHDAGFDELALPSSAPVSCFDKVLFQRIVIGRQYFAEVDGYDRDIAVNPRAPKAGEIVPSAVGSRIMVDGKTSAYVAPRWTTSCNSRWAPPVGDAGASKEDAAAPTMETANPRPPPFVSPRYPVYGDCRGLSFPDGGAPWLRGPVCAYDLATLTFDACDPLVDTAAKNP